MKNVHDIEIEVKGSDWESILDAAFKKKVKDLKVDGLEKANVLRIFIYKDLVLNLYIWMLLM